MSTGASEHDDDDAGGSAGGSGGGSGSAPPKRRGRPPGARTGTGTRGRPPTARIEKRAKKATEALRELVRLRMPDLDVSDKSFAETVDRDAAAWGDFLAQLGEWIPPFGDFLDLIVGAALVRVLRIAPSLRAGRRDLAARAAARRHERERQLAGVVENEEHAAPVEVAAGVFVNPEHVVEPELTREEWLAAGGVGVRPNAGFAHGHDGQAFDGGAE